METMIESPLARLSDEQVEELGRAFDAIHDEVFSELGEHLVVDRRELLADRRRPAPG